MPIINLEKTGMKLKDLIKKNDIKVIDLQKNLGFNNSQSIYKWFRGENLPTIDNLLIIATMLGVTIDDLLVKEMI